MILSDEAFDNLQFEEDVPNTGLEMLYRLEPQLREIEARAKQDSDPFFAYEQAKRSASRLVGYYATNPHLRSSGAWDCFFRHLVEELDL